MKHVLNNVYIPVSVTRSMLPLRWTLSGVFSWTACMMIAPADLATATTSCCMLLSVWPAKGDDINVDVDDSVSRIPSICCGLTFIWLVVLCTGVFCRILTLCYGTGGGTETQKRRGVIRVKEGERETSAPPRDARRRGTCLFSYFID